MCVVFVAVLLKQHQQIFFLWNVNLQLIEFQKEFSSLFNVRLVNFDENSFDDSFSPSVELKSMVKFCDDFNHLMSLMLFLFWVGVN